MNKIDKVLGKDIAEKFFGELPGSNDDPKAGMYEIGNKDWPQVTIGRFVIARQDDTSVWIQDEVDDDGAQFSDADVEKLLLDFYRKNF